MATNAFSNAVSKAKLNVDDDAEIVELARRKGFSESNGAAPKSSSIAKSTRKPRSLPEKKTITLRVNAEMHDWLITVAKYKRINVGNLIAKLIDTYEEKSGDDIDIGRFKEEMGDNN